MKFIVDSMLTGGIINWIVELLNWIAMWIDSIVYNILAGFYNIFIALARLDYGDISDMFGNLMTRIYLVMGLFMLFKISFNLLQMLVDPDKVKDSKIGGTAMAKHVFISLIMLVAFPLVFDLLGQAQTAILENGVIEKVVLGSGAESLTGEKAGASFSWTLLSAFLHPTQGTWTEAVNSGALSDKVLKAYNEVWDGQNYSLLQFASVVTDTTVSYTPIISTIVGIFIIFYLITFSFDVGARMFKLLLLELIAPIPIISYMDPGKGKDTFNRYKDEYISTYIELFVRLAIVFLALLLANKIMVLLSPDSGIFSFGSGDTAVNLSGIALTLAKVILVISLFNFAKSVPNLIKEIFGFKMGENKNKGLITGALLGAAGLAGGAIIGGGGAAIGSAMRGESFGKGVMNTLGGAGRGAVGMGKAGWGTKSLSPDAISKMGGAAVAGVKRQGVVSEATTAAGGWWNMQKGKFDNVTGGEYRAKRSLEGFDKNISDAQSKYDDMGVVRNVAAEQYAQSQHMTLSEARDAAFKNGTDFDSDVDAWMQQNSTNQAMLDAVSKYNREHTGQQPLSVSDFKVKGSSGQTTAFGRAKGNLETAQAAKTNYEKANKDRVKAREAARSLSKK